jgi:SAM-dependent methyltransferase
VELEGMMRPEAEKEIEQRLGGGVKRVLDVGGARELSRYATHVIDLLPYKAARAVWGRYFVERPIPPENWIGQDICDDRPFPFCDKFFDFAICSHILEDVRDPIRVCTELSRVSKARYVETPSPLIELTRGMEPGGKSWIGYYHHRWLVAVEDGELVFLFKPHFLHASRRFYFPQRYAARWQRQGKAYTRLFWEGELRAREKVIVVREEMEHEIEKFVHFALGESLPMKYARLRRFTWNVGVQVTDQLCIRDALRPLIGKIRKWY